MTETDEAIGLKQALRFAHILSEMRASLGKSADTCTFDELPAILRGCVIESEQRRAALAETRDALHQLQEKYDAFTTPVCPQCSGRGWITRSESHDLGNGLGAGGSWNEVCPTCQAIAPVKEQEP